MTPRGEPDLASLGLPAALAESFATLIVQILERRPDLVQRLRALCPEGTRAPLTVVEHMSVAAYAAHRCVSERTVRYEVKQMTEGVHYHRAGRQRRRVVIRVQEADRWHAENIPRAERQRGLEELAVDEVTRRRARVALAKRKEE